jgi:hypothetical protein
MKAKMPGVQLVMNEWNCFRAKSDAIILVKWDIPQAEVKGCTNKKVSIINICPAVSSAAELRYLLWYPLRTNAPMLGKKREEIECEFETLFAQEVVLKRVYKPRGRVLWSQPNVYTSVEEVIQLARGWFESRNPPIQ